MDDRAQALALLREKQQLLRQVEEQSEQMLAMQVDQLAAAMKKRQALLEQVQQRDVQLRRLCEDDGELRAALNQDAAFSDGPLEQLALASLQVKATANRILRGEDALRRHMNAERRRLRGKIEKLNRGSASVAKRYRQAMETGRTPWHQKKSRNF